MHVDQTTLPCTLFIDIYNELHIRVRALPSKNEKSRPLLNLKNEFDMIQQSKKDIEHNGLFLIKFTSTV